MKSKDIEEKRKREKAFLEENLAKEGISQEQFEKRKNERLRAGAAFVRGREKLRSQGLSKEEATVQTATEQENVNLEQISVADFQKMKKEEENTSPIAAEEAPLELGGNIFKRGLEKQEGIPKQTLGVIQSVNPSYVAAVSATKYLELATTEQLRAEGFTELDIKMLDEGKGNINKLAQMLEIIPFGLTRKRIPLLGVSLSNFAGKTAEDQIDELTDAIKKNSDTIGIALENAEKDPLKRRVYLAQAEESKQKILEAESQIKLIKIQSAEFIANPQKSINLDTEVLNVKLKHPEIFI